MPLCHIRIHIPRTASINQPPPSPLRLLPRNRQRHSNLSRLRDGISSTRPPFLLLPPIINGGLERLHERGDFGDRAGGEEGLAEGGRVVAEDAGGAADVDEAAGGLEEGEEGLAGFEGAVVVCFEGLFDDV